MHTFVGDEPIPLLPLAAAAIVALPATNAKSQGILAPILQPQSESAEWAVALHMSSGTHWDKTCPNLLVS